MADLQPVSTAMLKKVFGPWPLWTVFSPAGEVMSTSTVPALISSSTVLRRRALQYMCMMKHIRHALKLEVNTDVWCLLSGTPAGLLTGRQAFHQLDASILVGLIHDVKHCEQLHLARGRQAAGSSGVGAYNEHFHYLKRGGPAGLLGRCHGWRRYFDACSDGLFHWGGKSQEVTR